MIVLELYLKLNTKKYGEGLNVLTPKQMLQRLPKALAQVKASNTSENLLNKYVRVYNNIMNSIKL